MKLPVWAWVLIGVGAAAVIGVIVYFAAFYNRDNGPPATEAFERVEVRNPTTKHGWGSTVRPHGKIRAEFVGTHTGKLRWFFETDRGASVVEFAKGSGKRVVVYTIPDDTFSDTCTVRVTDGEDGTQAVSSSVFPVQPLLRVSGPGTNGPEQVLIGNNVKFQVLTTTWASLLPGKPVVQYSKDGNTSFVKLPGAHLDTHTSTLLWTPGALLLDTSVRLRVTTTKMVARGKSREIAYTLPHTLTVVDTASKSVTGIFTGVNLLHLSSNAVATTTYPGAQLTVAWSASEALAGDVEVSWAGTAAGPFTALKTVTGTSTAVITVPEVSLGTFVVRVSSGGSQAVSASLDVKEGWEFDTSGVKPAAITITHTGWVFAVPVILHESGTTPASWSTELVFAGSTWKLTPGSNLTKMEILKQNSSSNESSALGFNFVYHIRGTPPNMPKGPSTLTFRVSLKHASVGAAKTGPLTYTIGFPDPSGGGGAGACAEDSTIGEGVVVFQDGVSTTEWEDLPDDAGGAGTKSKRSAVPLYLSAHVDLEETYTFSLLLPDDGGDGAMRRCPVQWVLVDDDTNDEYVVQSVRGLSADIHLDGNLVRGEAGHTYFLRVTDGAQSVESATFTVTESYPRLYPGRGNMYAGRDNKLILLGIHALNETSPDIKLELMMEGDDEPEWETVEGAVSNDENVIQWTIAKDFSRVAELLRLRCTVNQGTPTVSIGLYTVHPPITEEEPRLLMAYDSRPFPSATICVEVVPAAKGGGILQVGDGFQDNWQEATSTGTAGCWELPDNVPDPFTLRMKNDDAGTNIAVDGTIEYGSLFVFFRRVERHGNASHVDMRVWHPADGAQWSSTEHFEVTAVKKGEVEEVGMKVLYASPSVVSARFGYSYTILTLSGATLAVGAYYTVTVKSSRDDSIKGTVTFRNV